MPASGDLAWMNRDLVWPGWKIVIWTKHPGKTGWNGCNYAIRLNVAPNLSCMLSRLIWTEIRTPRQWKVSRWAGTPRLIGTGPKICSHGTWTSQDGLLSFAGLRFIVPLTSCKFSQNTSTKWNEAVPERFLAREKLFISVPFSAHFSEYHFSERNQAPVKSSLRHFIWLRSTIINQCCSSLRGGVNRFRLGTQSYWSYEGF